jgi:hypothetical protein
LIKDTFDKALGYLFIFVPLLAIGGALADLVVNGFEASKLSALMGWTVALFLRLRTPWE